MKIRPVGAEELFHAEDGRTDSQTDTTNLMVAFRNFVKAPINTPVFKKKRPNF
jgi:hypothetical protein